MHGVPISVVVGKLNDKDTQALEGYKEKMCTKATGFKQRYLQTERKLPRRKKKKNITKKVFFSLSLSLSKRSYRKNTFDSIHLSDNAEITILAACAYASKSEKASATSPENESSQVKK